MTTADVINAALEHYRLETDPDPKMTAWMSAEFALADAVAQERQGYGLWDSPTWNWGPSE